MARYMTLPEGVLDRDTGAVCHPAYSPELWAAYLTWVVAGNAPDPFVPTPPPAETLPLAKARKAHAIKTEGLARMQTRFPALATFDTVQLLRETILSVLPAARSLTADMQFISDTYTAGKAALAAVQAATTIAEVDAVAPAWPPT